ncbi:unnamed protein product [Lactuca virosa]|uniref:Protein ENHANCED DISEASE RESISTANCE 2 C-terminal domain-containing protein n=1 Tax=Lactuca virosa TaxID=75947 RepID=A0AAU9P2R1_9ASTR|nr:unnamed protein product [Lactuca virosa]
MHLSLLRLMMLLKFSRFSLASAIIDDIISLRLALSSTSGPPPLNSLVSPSPINISGNNAIYIKVYASNLNLLMSLQASRSNPEGISDILIPSFNQRLAAGEWFTARVFACGLFHIAYPSASKMLMAELRSIQDDMPIVRRSASTNMGKFATTVEPSHLKTDVMQIFEHLTQDAEPRKGIRSVYVPGSKCIPFAQVLAKPNYNLVLYFAADRPIAKDSLQEIFINGTNTFRDSRFKLIPSIVDGYRMVKRGSRACLLGKVETCNYLRQDNFLEVNV